MLIRDPHFKGELFGEAVGMNKRVKNFLRASALSPIHQHSFYIEDCVRLHTLRSKCIRKNKSLHQNLL